MVPPKSTCMCCQHRRILPKRFAARAPPFSPHHGHKKRNARPVYEAAPSTRMHAFHRTNQKQRDPDKTHASWQRTDLSHRRRSAQEGGLSEQRREHDGQRLHRLAAESLICETMKSLTVVYFSLSRKPILLSSYRNNFSFHHDTNADSCPRTANAPKTPGMLSTIQEMLKTVRYVVHQPGRAVQSLKTFGNDTSPPKRQEGRARNNETRALSSIHELEQRRTKIKAHRSIAREGRGLAFVCSRRSRPHTRENSNETFVPPKPKELLITASKSPLAFCDRDRHCRRHCRRRRRRRPPKSTAATAKRVQGHAERSAPRKQTRRGCEQHRDEGRSTRERHHVRKGCCSCRPQNHQQHEQKKRLNG